MNQAVIESGRADFALNVVKDTISKENDETTKAFKSYTRNFPSLILSNGIAASIAFVLEESDINKKPSSKGRAYSLIYLNISKWLVKTGILNESTKLVEYVCSLNSDDYRIVTNEVLSLFVWIKRFASGLIEGEE